MEISHSPFKRNDLVKVVGRVDSSTAPKLTEALTRITDSGRYRIILDMSGLEFMSSAGLRTLINVQKSCKRYNRGELALAGIPPNIKSALELAGLTPLFAMYDDALTAIGNV